MILSISFVCCSCLLSDLSRLSILRLDDRLDSLSFCILLVAFAIAKAVASVAVRVSAVFILIRRLLPAVSCLAKFL